jgi:aspartate racemase
MNTHQPIIGILAGMGPKSTGPFIDQVVSQYQIITGAKDDIDFPPMMIYSLPTPFYLDRPIDHKLMEKTICTGLKKLETCGTAFVAMPCNTAHLYFETLQTCIHIPLLNIVNVTLDAVPSSAKKIAILGTRPTIDSQIFQKGLAQRELKYVLHSSWQSKIDEIILKIKTGNDLSVLLDLWRTLSADLLSENVDTILLVCTDLNVIFNQVQSPFQIIDSSLCLAKSIVYKWRDL